MKKQAFTLIELLVVVLIIGILAAIAVPQYQKAVLKSRLSNLKTLVSSIVRAQEVYFLSNNTYTSNLEDLSISLPPALEIETDDTTSNLFYDWGICRISLQMVKCKNSQSGIQYGQYFMDVGYRGGNRECCAQTENLYSNALCKNETGKEESFFTGSDFNLGYSISCYSYD